MNLLANYRNSNTLLYSLLGITLGILIVTLPLLHTLVIICGIALLIAGASKPEYMILTIVILTSSMIYEDSLPILPIGIGSLHVQDIMLLFLIGLIIYRTNTNNKATFVRTPLNKPLALFVMSVIISAFISIYYYDVDYNWVMRRLRDVSYYLVFYLVTNLITEKKQIQSLLRGLFIIAMSVAVIMLIQAAVGESTQLLPGRVEAVKTISNEFEATRILPPGQTLIYVLFITVICFIAFMEEKFLLQSGYFYIFILLAIGVVLTYNRSYWITVILACSILLFLPAAGNKLRLLSLLAVVTTIGVLLVILGGSGSKMGETFAAVSDRFTSLFAGKELSQSNSLEYRYEENRHAISQIKKHPVFGIGLGNDYRPQVFGNTDINLYYMHNGYLWVLTDIGIIGFVSLMWAFLCFLIRAMKNWKNIEQKYLKAAVVGFMLSGIGMLLMALYIPLFMEGHSIVVIAILMGLSETIIIKHSKVEAEAEHNTSTYHRGVR